MKKYFLILILVVSEICLAQGNDIKRYDMAFIRIEQAFHNASPSDLWPLFYDRITIRIEDSLYQNVLAIHTESLLKRFFQNKDSVEFRFGGKFFHYGSAECNGILNYIFNKKHESLNVDVRLDDEALITHINISNYPSSKAFFNFSK